MSDIRDPRVFFAAERTLLSWNRTSLTLMAFGFVIERFGLFLQLLSPTHAESAGRGISFWVGIVFILLGAYSAFAATMQFRKVIKTLKPAELIEGYSLYNGAIVSILVAALGAALTVYLFFAQ